MLDTRASDSPCDESPDPDPTVSEGTDDSDDESETLPHAGGANGHRRQWTDFPQAGLPVSHIPGIGPVIARDLERLGYTTVADLAAVTRDDRDELRVALGHDGWRLDHGRWVQKARRLLDPPTD
jgi:predicted flap endonuclease-1-like 5' DNA nuclease